MRAYRSPIRLFVSGLIGLLLILAASDIMFGHWVSTEPENTDGALTTRGQAQQRGDILWGAVMIGTGTLLAVGAVVELVRRQPQAVITAEGVELPMGAHEAEIVVPWSNVRDVRSEVTTDELDGSHREQLVIDVLHKTGLPPEPHGAEWENSQLRVDAHDWTKGAGDVALAAQGALGHYRRVEQIKQMEQPSLTWHTTVARPMTTPDDDSGIDAGAGGSIHPATELGEAGDGLGEPQAPTLADEDAAEPDGAATQHEERHPEQQEPGDNQGDTEVDT